MITVINLETGEKVSYAGKLMVAPNGMAFIKQGNQTVWFSAATNFEAYQEDAHA